MIGVSVKPLPSRAFRIAPTRPSIMSLGAMMSAPACGVRDGFLDEQFERLVVVDITVLDNAAMAVRGVFAKANVGDDEISGKCLFDLADRFLDYAVARISTGTNLVLFRRDAEEKDRTDAEVTKLLAFAEVLSTDIWYCPGIDEISFFTSRPRR